MRIQSTQKTSQAQTRANRPSKSDEIPQAEPRDQVTLADRAKSGAKFGLTGAALITVGFAGFTAIEAAFGYRTGLTETALQLALSAGGAGLVGAAFGVTVGVES